MSLTDKQRAYWRKNLRVTGVLLGIWFVVTYVTSYFARELNQFVVMGFPLGFYMGAQGALLIYVAIIWFYARYMNMLDREHDVHEGDDS